MLLNHKFSPRKSWKGARGNNLLHLCRFTVSWTSPCPRCSRSSRVRLFMRLALKLKHIFNHLCRCSLQALHRATGRYFIISSNQALHSLRSEDKWEWIRPDFSLRPCISPDAVLEHGAVDLMVPADETPFVKIRF